MKSSHSELNIRKHEWQKCLRGAVIILSVMLAIFIEKGHLRMSRCIVYDVYDGTGREQWAESSEQRNITEA